MLIIARKRGEAIRIGDDTVVVIHEVHGKHVKLAIEAPPEIRILRTELEEEAIAASEENDGIHR